MKFKPFKIVKTKTKTKTKTKKLVGMTEAYSCEYCGDQHQSCCDTCAMPPCRCLC